MKGQGKHWATCYHCHKGCGRQDKCSYCRRWVCPDCRHKHDVLMCPDPATGMPTRRSR